MATCRVTGIRTLKAKAAEVHRRPAVSTPIGGVIEGFGVHTQIDVSTNSWNKGGSTFHEQLVRVVVRERDRPIVVRIWRNTVVGTQRERNSVV